MSNAARDSSNDQTLNSDGSAPARDHGFTEAEVVSRSGAVSVGELAALVRAEQRQRWQNGDRVPVEYYLTSFPTLDANEAAVLDLVYNEILLHEERGETPDLDDYARRFPSIADSLRRQYELHQQMLGGPTMSTRSPVVTKGSLVMARTGPVGPQVTGYDIESELGRGGMGVVYKARHLKLNRVVALKMIIGGAHAGSSEMLRFRTEAEAVASLQHPNIVQIYEVGEQDGLPFFALEFVDGGSLSDLIDRGDPMAGRPAAQLLATLARAMHAAHQRGIIHRDLKPDNVLMTKDGNPKVTDFGLAKRLDSDAGQTQSGSIMGTPCYMAPEQAAGNTRAIGVLADVYSLGAILYELLTRRPPFDADTPLETLRQVVEKDPVPPSRYNPNVPRDLETICLKCLEKDANRRYPSALALADDLQRFLNDEPIQARPTGPLERAVKWTRRHPALTAVYGFLLLALLGGITGGIIYHFEVEKDLEKEKRILAAVDSERKKAEVARADAMKSQAEAERRLIDMTVVTGMQMVDNGDLLGSVPWLVHALELEMKQKEPDVEREKLHRVRIGSVLNQTPCLLRMFFHKERVTDAAYSPDGKQVLTACADGKARLWNAATGQLDGPVLEHKDVVRHASFNRDGSRVVTASEDGTARVWDVASRESRVLRHQASVNSAEFSPDGRHVVTASDDRTAQVWDAASGKPVGKPMKHEGPVRHAAFDPDGKRVVTGSDDDTAHVWDAATGESLLPPLKHDDDVNYVAFSPDGKRVATASADSRAILWDAATGKPLRTLEHTAPVLFLAFAPDGKHLVTAGDDNTARIWSTATGERIGAPLRHGSTVLSATFRHDPIDNKLYVATASDDNTARVWDAETGTPMSPPLKHNATVYKAVYHPFRRELLIASADGTARIGIPGTKEILGPDFKHRSSVTTAIYDNKGQVVLTATKKGMVHLWDVASGDPIGEPMTHKGRVYAAVFRPDGRQAATAGEDKVARLWDTSTSRQVGSDLAHDDEVRTAAYSPDGKLVATGSVDKTARLWNTTTGARVAEFKGHEGTVNSVRFSPDGSRLVTASADHTARVWNVADPSAAPVVLGHSEDVYHAAFSPDGRQVVTAGSDRIAQVWDAATGRKIGEPMRHSSKVYDAAFDPRGERVVTSSDDNTARVWDARTGQPLTPPLRHGGTVNRAVFGPEGMRVATASDDNTARVWSAETGEPLTPPLPHQAAVLTVQFAPDGNDILTGSGDRTARIWKLPPDKHTLPELIEIAQLMSGGWFDKTNSVVPLEAGKFEELWRKIGGQCGTAKLKPK